jgi:hypothetical protein
MHYFAEFKEHIVTANADGAIPLNAKSVGTLVGVDRTLMSQLIAQANLGKDLADALKARNESAEIVNAIRKYNAAAEVKF